MYGAPVARAQAAKQAAAVRAVPKAVASQFFSASHQQRLAAGDAGDPAACAGGACAGDPAAGDAGGGDPATGFASGAADCAWSCVDL